MTHFKSQKKHFWLASLTLLFFLLTSCSKPVQQRQTDSLTADLNYNTTITETESSLAIPPSLTRPDTSSLFNNDRQIIKRASQVLSNEVATGTLIQDSEKVKVKKMGPYRWLEVKAPQIEVFNSARKFLLDLGFDLAIDDVAIGLLETGWQENQPNIPADSLGMVRSALSRGLGQVFSEGKIDRFRIRVDLLDDNTSEIFVTHQSMIEEDIVGNNTWRFADSDPELEIEVSYRLLIYLGMSEQDASEVMTQSPKINNMNESQEPTFFETAEGLTYRISEPFSRAWLKLGWAIDRSDYIIYDKNRQAGIFYIKAGETLLETRKGFLDQLLFWQQSTDLDSARLQVKLQSNQIDNSTLLNVFLENGVKLPHDEARIFLEDVVQNF